MSRLIPYRGERRNAARKAKLIWRELPRGTVIKTSGRWIGQIIVRVPV